MSEEAKQRSELVIAGPTGSGKTALAKALAERLGGEIVSFDSVQIYRGFDIGSAKEKDLGVPQHMVDVADWHEDYDAARYATEARAVVDDVHRRGRLPILAGGTGLYLRAFFGEGWHGDLPKDEALRARLKERETEDLYGELERLDPDRAAELHPNDRFRVIRALELATLLGGPVSALRPAEESRRAESFVIVLDPPRPQLHASIARRAAEMLGRGLVDEVKGLLAAGVPRDAKPMRAIGYAQVAAHLAGEIPASELEEKIIFATRQYAKRQCTWFRKVSADLRLTASPDPDELALFLRKVLSQAL